MEVIEAPASVEQPFKQPICSHLPSIKSKGKQIEKCSARIVSFAGLLDDILHKFAVGHITIWAHQLNGKHCKNTNVAQTQTLHKRSDNLSFGPKTTTMNAADKKKTFLSKTKGSIHQGVGRWS